MPGPGCGECTAPQTGPGILLLGLGLSEGLGSDARRLVRGATLQSLLGAPRRHPAPRCRPCRATFSSRRRGPWMSARKLAAARRTDSMPRLPTQCSGSIWHGGSLSLVFGSSPPLTWRTSCKCPLPKPRIPDGVPELGGVAALAWCSRLAALWLFSSRRKALTLLEHRTAVPSLPNVRGKPGPTGKRLARGADDELNCAAGQALCCWGSA